MDNDDWGDWPEWCVGMHRDARAAVSAIQWEVKGGFGYGRVPPLAAVPAFYGPGVEVPGLITTLGFRGRRKR